MFRVVAVERADPGAGLQVVQDDADEEQDEKQRKEQDEPQVLLYFRTVCLRAEKRGRYLLRMCFTSQASRSSFPRANSRWKAS